MTFGASGWHENEDAHLIKCLDEGMSFNAAAAAISAKFGTHRSRNSAIGRAHRLGIHSKVPKSQNGMSKYDKSKPWERFGLTYSGWIKRQRAARQASSPKPKNSNIPPMKFKTEPLTGMRSADVEPMRVSFADLSPDGCRWPYGTGPFTFCNCRAVEGAQQPYCAPHLALSHARAPMTGREHSDETRAKMCRAHVTRFTVASVVPGDAA